MFKQRHYWAVDVGPATFIGLSTTRFRRWVVGAWVTSVRWVARRYIAAAGPALVYGRQLAAGRRLRHWHELHAAAGHIVARTSSCNCPR